ncbi:phosphatidylinositol N-acetylglucosaminyltransferase subunit C-like isoform X2 [Limulus polyphemus]|nr:phosphatidylinositol N-acetylglucosaminyltransferase subunit C-like isoform X2 [Limulus polyphemus]XP_022255020.1 phosphatidylinositol N-acetylglucosaminyltransferase subunit C-like isoform X2 [Limulus polyphemus]
MWKKILYKKQAFPDNYVDQSFLCDLNNVNGESYSIQQSFFCTTAVTQEICCTCIFVVIFANLVSETLSPSFVISSSGLLVVIFYLFFSTFLDKTCYNLLSKGFEDLKSVVIFMSFALGFSSIMKTLTETISTDTVYAMSTFMFLVHLVFHDYGAHAVIVSETISINAAVFATVCLGSRLPNEIYTFALLLIGAEVFVLSPVPRRYIQENCPFGQVVLTVLLTCITMLLMGSFETPYLLCTTIVLVCVNFLCPLYFVYCQAHKRHISGPWDEAVVWSS